MTLEIRLHGDRSVSTVTVSSSFCQKINTSNHLLLHNKQATIHHRVTGKGAGYRVSLRYWRLCSADTTPCVRHGRRQGTEPCCTVQIHHCVTARREGFGASQRYGDSQAGREPSPTETLTSLQCRYNTVCQAWTEAGYWAMLYSTDTSLCNSQAGRVWSLTEVWW